MMKKRIPGIKILIVVLAALLLLTPFAGCAAEEEVAAPAEEEEEGPKYGGTLRIASSANFYTLDPAGLMGWPDVDIDLALYNGLVRRIEDMSIEPVLAVSWEPNADASQYTFKLRQGVKFHNGKDFKAEDVVFTFNRLIDPDVGSAAASQLDHIENIIAVDDYTVRFELSRSDAFFVDVLCVYQALILPKGVDTESLTTAEYGTGPFTLEEFVEGEYAILKKNPDYWEEGLPYLDEIRYYFMAEDATRLAALRAGEIDIEAIPPPSELGIAEDLINEGFAVPLVGAGNYNSLAMDMRVEPFNNKLVRQALQLATDRDKINQVMLFGYGTIARDHPIIPADPYFAAEMDVPAYDPKAAKELLAEAGYPDGIDLDLNTAERYGQNDLAVAFKECAAAAGIRVNIIMNPEDTYYGEVWMQVPFSTCSWGARTPLNAINLTYKTGVPWNESFYANAELDALLVAVAAEPDLAKRKEIFASMQEIMIDDVPRIIPAFVPAFYFTTTAVQGLIINPPLYMYVERAWLDE
jgi:peptide/nickel transport system substrate-binding protein